MTDGDPIGQDDSQDEGRETPVAPVPSAPRNNGPLMAGLMIGGGVVALIVLLVLGAFTLFNGGSTATPASGALHFDSYDATTDQIRENVRTTLESNSAVCGVISSWATLAAIGAVKTMTYQDFIEILGSVKAEAAPTPVGAIDKPGQTANPDDAEEAEGIYADECARLGTGTPQSGWSSINRSLIVNGCVTLHSAFTCNCLGDYLELHLDERIFESWVSGLGDEPQAASDAISQGMSSCGGGGPIPTDTPIVASQLITPQEIESALGGDWHQTSTVVCDVYCTFADDNGILSGLTVSLLVYSLGDSPEQEFYDRHAGALVHTSLDHEVSGVGDDAYWSQNNGLDVRKGNIDINVRVSLGLGGYRDESKSLSIAKIVVNNLTSR